MRRPRLTNRAARAHFLHRHLLARSPAQPVGDILGHLGFVQVDSINTVARAHDLILWSRRQAYRPKDLRRLVDKDRTAFEHWTHDASILPVSHFPHWRLKFELERQRLLERWREWRRDGFEAKMDGVLARIAAHGPFCSADVGEDEERSSGGWWDWHPSK
ncbi:MAG: crosslink repair DNA glycosylase YcaQ family protein, partial [Pseudomonadota bacterium]